MPSQTTKRSKTPRTRVRTRSKPPGRIRELALLKRYSCVAGVDEVGRGAWAGPLVAGAVILDTRRINQVRDSKLLTASRRELVAERIKQKSRGWAVGVVEIEELNRRGLTWGLREAACRALAGLSERPDCVLLDGHHAYLGRDYDCETIIGGDLKELCIAAASVVAKVHRDRLMAELDAAYPEFGLADNKGYGTMQHRQALEEHGPTAIHRHAWKPIAELLQAPLPLPE